MQEHILQSLSEEIRDTHKQTATHTTQAGYRYLVTVNPATKERLLDGPIDCEILRYPNDGPLYSNGHEYLDRLEAVVPPNVHFPPLNVKV